MSPDASPGQIAYETFVRVGYPEMAEQVDELLWQTLRPELKHAWEVAAQAVLALKPRAGFILSRAELEHLLNCLANQKFLHEMAEPLRHEAQALIDMAWRKGMYWLMHGPREDTP